MLELIKEYINKDCIIYTMNSVNSQVVGIIKDVKEGWISVDNGKGIEVINLDYVMRIREYPTDKKGKRKSLVLD